MNLNLSHLGHLHRLNVVYPLLNKRQGEKMMTENVLTETSTQLWKPHYPRPPKKNTMYREKTNGKMI